VSVIDAYTLHETQRKAEKNYQKEHVTPYILENYIRYKLGEYKCTSNLGHIRLTLDESDDLKVIQELYDNLYDNNNYFGFQEVMEYIHANPKILEYNSHIMRDEGLFISKRNEGIA
jgi:spore coat polysaccharide biosynthesis protein SpsF